MAAPRDRQTEKHLTLFVFFFQHLYYCNVFFTTHPSPHTWKTRMQNEISVNTRESVQSPLLNISILFKTPKQTTKYSIHRFPHSFQIDSASMLFLEQGLRTVDVYVCVLKPQVSPADRVLCCCQWELAVISYPLSGCLQSQENDKHL